MYVHKYVVTAIIRITCALNFNHVVTHHRAKNTLFPKCSITAARETTTYASKLHSNMFY